MLNRDFHPYGQPDPRHPWYQNRPPWWIWPAGVAVGFAPSIAAYFIELYRFVDAIYAVAVGIYRWGGSL